MLNALYMVADALVVVYSSYLSNSVQPDYYSNSVQNNVKRPSTLLWVSVDD